MDNSTSYLEDKIIYQHRAYQRKPILVIREKALFAFQSTLEVVLTPITDRYLGFTPTQNAYVYGITGGFSSLGYLSLLGPVLYSLYRTDFYQKLTLSGRPLSVVGLPNVTDVRQTILTPTELYMI